MDQPLRSDIPSRSNTPELSDRVVIDMVPDNTWDSSEVGTVDIPIYNTDL